MMNPKAVFTSVMILFFAFSAQEVRAQDDEWITLVRTYVAQYNIENPMAMLIRENIDQQLRPSEQTSPSEQIFMSHQLMALGLSAIRAMDSGIGNRAYNERLLELMSMYFLEHENRRAIQSLFKLIGRSSQRGEEGLFFNAHANANHAERKDHWLPHAIDGAWKVALTVVAYRSLGTMRHFWKKKPDVGATDVPSRTRGIVSRVGGVFGRWKKESAEKFSQLAEQSYRKAWVVDKGKDLGAFTGVLVAGGALYGIPAKILYSRGQWPLDHKNNPFTVLEAEYHSAAVLELSCEAQKLQKELVEFEVPLDKELRAQQTKSWNERINSVADNFGFLAETAELYFQSHPLTNQWSWNLSTGEIFHKTYPELNFTCEALRGEVDVSIPSDETNATVQREVLINLEEVREVLQTSISAYLDRYEAAVYLEIGEKVKAFFAVNGESPRTPEQTEDLAKEIARDMMLSWTAPEFNRFIEPFFLALIANNQWQTNEARALALAIDERMDQHMAAGLLTEEDRNSYFNPQDVLEEMILEEFLQEIGGEE